MNIILASTSPRRQQLLSVLDINFCTAGVDIDESVLVDESPKAYIKRMVQQKAQAFISSHQWQSLQNKNKNNNNNNKDNTLILTADTIGVMPDANEVLIKPVDKADAISMWQKMSGTAHYVWTAVRATVINTENETLWTQVILEETKVYFIDLNITDMDAYWYTGEPVDKAGGYAIQGKAAAWVKTIEGSYTNVVGLPLAQTKQLIDEAETAIKNNIKQ